MQSGSPGLVNGSWNTRNFSIGVMMRRQAYFGYLQIQVLGNPSCQEPLWTRDCSALTPQCPPSATSSLKTTAAIYKAFQMLCALYFTSYSYKSLRFSNMP